MKARTLRNSQAGFSLVELMIVVAIIGILATIAIPNFQRFQAKARQSEARNNLSAYYSTSKATYSEWNVYIGNFVAVGFRPEGRLGYRIAVLDIGAAGMPTGYTGPTLATCVSTQFENGNAACAANSSDGTLWNSAWTENVTGAVVATAAAVCAPAIAANSFTACASGRHNGAALADEWSINQQKVVTNSQNGI